MPKGIRNPSPICSIEGCLRPHKARGWCAWHWKRWARHGDPVVESGPAPKKLCKIEGCAAPHHCRGWCRKHYVRWHTHGSPHVLKIAPSGEPLRWLVQAVSQETDDCIMWPYGATIDGYGSVKVDGKAQPAHALVLMLTGQPRLQEAPLALHSCDNPPCCNKRHLRWGTDADNSGDCVSRGRRGKPFGHKLTPSAVRKIRNDPRPPAVIAIEYGVHPGTIYRARNGRTWRDI